MNETLKQAASAAAVAAILITPFATAAGMAGPVFNASAQAAATPGPDLTLAPIQLTLFLWGVVGITLLCCAWLVLLVLLAPRERRAPAEAEAEQDDPLPPTEPLPPLYTTAQSEQICGAFAWQQPPAQAGGGTMNPPLSRRARLLGWIGHPGPM